MTISDLLTSKPASMPQTLTPASNVGSRRTHRICLAPSRPRIVRTESMLRLYAFHEENEVFAASLSLAWILCCTMLSPCTAALTAILFLYSPSFSTSVCFLF